METNIRNKCKAYTSLEQSKKLAEFLPIESADMGYIPSADDDDGNTLYTAEFKSEFIFDEDCCILCWSLAALLDVLPEIQGSKPVIALDDNYITYPHMSGLHFKADNLVDACYEMIIKLHDQKLL